MFSIGMGLPALFIIAEQESLRIAAAFVAVYGSVILAPPLGLVTQRIRRLLTSGHTLADLQAALRTEVERRREELAYSHDVEPSFGEKASFGVAAVAGGVLAASFAVMSGWFAPAELGMWMFVGSVAAGTVSLSVGTTLRSRRIDAKA